MKDTKKSTKITVIILFAAIIIVFVFWGVPGKDQGGPANFAAIVNNKVISISDFQRQYKMYQQRAQMFGMQDNQFFQNLILQQLVKQEAVYQQAENENVFIPESEIRTQIFSNSVFQKDGQFQRDLYYNILTANNLTVADFQESLKKDSVHQEVQSLFDYATKTNPLEVAKSLESENLVVKIDYATLDKDTFKKSVAPGELQKFISSEEGKTQITNYYDQNKSSKYSKNEEVRARHILIKFKAGDEKEKANALKKIKALHDKAIGENFELVAKNNSEDLGSKDKGGDLGFFGKGKMVPEFDNVAFKLKPGEISDVVESQFGFHIIKLEERKNPDVTPIEKVQDEIANLLLKDRVFETAITEIKNELSQKEINISKLDSLIKNNNLDWKSNVSLKASQSDIEGVGKSDDFIEMAFSLNAKNKVLNRFVQVGKKHYVLKFVSLENKPADLTDKKSEEILSRLSSGRSQDSLNTWTQKVVKNSKTEINPSLSKE